MTEPTFVRLTTADGPRPFPLFTSRYGISQHLREDKEHFAVRHGGTHLVPFQSDHCEREYKVRCRCSGSTPNGRPRPTCCARATGEDFRCDECREWCYAVDEAHNKHPFPLSPHIPDAAERLSYEWTRVPPRGSHIDVPRRQAQEGPCRQPSTAQERHPAQQQPG
jgi:hypothetical protein